ncbi:MAG: ABC transporter permease [Dethiosulfovibrio peptidovorans]|nr:MAG: ABC transporter permease [Dethiosulfovibrio peptidovorans]
MLGRSGAERLIDGAATATIVFGSWFLLNLFFSPLVVPTMGSVWSELCRIATTPDLYGMIVVTAIRLGIGLVIGLIIGVILGIAMGFSRHLGGILSPIVGLFQTVPPVAWVVLALVWFGFNGKPAIFIVLTATVPVISINVRQGIDQIDHGLLEMAQLYAFSRRKILRHVVLPSVAPYFSSGFRIALGTGWKIAVMGEVLTTNDGIGGMIKNARLNVEPEAIVAWSVVVVGLYYLSDWSSHFILPRRPHAPHL